MATNRDEMLGRPWLPPGRHWSEHPGVVAGLDRLGGGSWLGVNDRGVAAAVTNRTGTLGPVSGKHSRGELILKALTCPDAATAAEELSGLNQLDYRAFNLIVADAEGVFWIFHRDGETGEGIGYTEVPEGLSMLTDRGLNDFRSDRIRRYLPQFRAALYPDPDAKDGWASWKELLADRRFDSDAGPRSAMTLSDAGFGTLSSSLIAVPAHARSGGHKVEWLFAAGPSDRTPYYRIDA